MTTENELLPCPFCGAEAKVLVKRKDFHIVGCDTDPYQTMLCPRPRLTVYPDDTGVYSYKFWNWRGGKHA